MALVLTEEQQLLRATAREFLEEKAPLSQLRALRDGKDPVGFSRALWEEMAELGWAGVPFPEEFGGAGLGHVELGVLLEECGRTLAATPLVSTLLLGGNAVLLGGHEALRKDVLSAVCAGRRILALALQEGSRHDPHAVAARAESTGQGYRLSGRKSFVLDGHVADQLVVVARTSGGERERDGLSLFLVDADAPGVAVARTWMVDGRNAARVTLDGVEVDGGALLGEPDRGADLLDAVLDRATAGLCAEMLGLCEEAFARTLAYLKERKQFGVPIGSFQALKHRAARLFIAIELSRSAALEALQAIDAGSDALPQLASAAKAQLSETAFEVGNEAVQMHGGIGVTDEEDVGLFLKRARVAQFTFGDASFHRDRYAALREY